MSKKRGQARLIELSLALIVLLLGFLIINFLNVLMVSTKSFRDLSNVANRVLTMLDERDVLYWMIYGEDGNGNVEFSRKVLESILLPSYGYNLTVYNKDWEMLWSVSRQFDAKRSASEVFVYLTFNGKEDVRVIVLSISGGE
ncbi:MAG: hypothetical protein QXJ72_06075 [Thermoproteota archaeon]